MIVSGIAPATGTPCGAVAAASRTGDGSVGHAASLSHTNCQWLSCS